MEEMLNYASEFIFILCGFVSFNAAFRAAQNEKGVFGTIVFWSLLGIIFIFGKLIPYELTGALLLVMGCLTMTKQVQMGKFEAPDLEKRKESSEKIGSKIFLPAILVGLVALILSRVELDGIALPGALMVGTGCILALFAAMWICRPTFQDTRNDVARLLMQVGSASLLPQLLGALGQVFTKAGVGDVISVMISGLIPEGNIFMGVVVYCLGMVIFTMIMGNAFAAFSVITVGIGIPFVIAHGGDPSVVGALGMTCGFCGTLMTPMAANFNIVPCAVLETKDKWTVIKRQAPMAFVMIVIHILLMYGLAF